MSRTQLKTDALCEPEDEFSEEKASKALSDGSVLSQQDGHLVKKR